MKIKINGCEIEDYHLSNKELYDIVNSDTDEITAEQRDFLTKKLCERFKSQCCPRDGETEANVFARQFGDYVNGKCGYNYYKTAELLAKDHRYLQQEMFKICLEYIKILAENAENGRFDARNEWACTASKHMIDGLKMADYPY